VRKKHLPENLYFAYLSLLIVVIIWAAAGPIIKLTLDYIPPFTFLLFRFLIVCLILLPFIILELSKNPIDKRDIYKFILLGLSVQTTLGLLFVGLLYTGAIDAAIIGVIGPLLTVIAGHYFYKEKMNKVITIGLILATMGTVFIVFEPLLSNGEEINHTNLRIWGNFLVLLSVLGHMIFTVWSKMIMGKNSSRLVRTFRLIHIKPMHKIYSPFILMGTTFYIGLISMVPLAILENYGFFGHAGFSMANMSLTPLLGLLYMALLSSIAAYLLYEWALHLADVGDTAIFSYLGPVFTLPFAYILLSEVPTPVMLIGAGFIAVGVIIAEKAKA
jgi:drug/metabolite transporter (DMT)-like permease